MKKLRKLKLLCLLSCTSLSFEGNATPTQKPSFILSVDGGGIRGVIPAHIIHYISTELDMHPSEIFDEFLGTSTGGLIALGLSAKKKDGSPLFSTQEIVDLYEKHGKDIFDSSILRQGITRAEYSNEKLRALLKEKFQDTQLNQTKKNVTVTSFSLDHGKPYYFSSHKALSNNSHNYYLRDAALATSAAPTFFTPAQICPPTITSCTESQRQTFIDGGVIMNNPALLSILGKSNKPNKNIIVVSLGTGSAPTAVSPEKVEEGGALQWVRPLIQIMLDGTSQATHDVLSVLNAISPSKSYYRFQEENLPKTLAPMDKTSAGHLLKLKGAAFNIITKHKKEINELIATIRKAKNTGLIRSPYLDEITDL